MSSLCHHRQDAHSIAYEGPACCLDHIVHVDREHDWRTSCLVLVAPVCHGCAYNGTNQTWDQCWTRVTERALGVIWGGPAVGGHGDAGHGVDQALGGGLGDGHVMAGHKAALRRRQALGTALGMIREGPVAGEVTAGQVRR